jgi:tetratricopeptide (TPR) repeat protein
VLRGLCRRVTTVLTSRSIPRSPFSILHSPFLLCGLAWCATGLAADPPPNAGDIDRAIHHLGNPSFEVRERASQLLWKAGFAAEAALAKAVRSDDLEVAKRARQIYDKVKLGITPEMPADVAELIVQFYRGDEPGRTQAWNALLQRQQFDVLLRLVDVTSDSNPARAQQLAEQLAKRIDGVVGALLINGSLDEAERWLLRFHSRSELVMQHYVAFLLNTERLDRTVTRLIDSGSGTTNAADARLLAHLLRASGEWSKARDAAERSGDERLRNDMLFRQRDFAELSRRAPTVNRMPSKWEPGYQAAFLRLAGDHEGFGRVIDELRRTSSGDQPKPAAYAFGKVFQINGRWHEAVEVCRQPAPEIAFDVLVAQGRWRDAFEVLGLRDPSRAAEWYRDLKNDKRFDVFQPQRVAIGLRGVRGLYQVGEREAAAALLEEMRRVDLKRSHWPDVCRMAVQVGWQDLALDQAGDLLFAKPTNAPAEFVPPGQVFEALFRKQATRALVLWHVLCERNPFEDRWRTLRRVRALMSLRFVRELDQPDVAKLLRELELMGKLFETKATPGINRSSWPAAWLQSFAETALLHGDQALARHYYQRWAEVASDAEGQIHVGDTWANEKNWPAAAEAYAAAVQRDPRSALAHSLWGYSLRQLGQTERADAELRLASLLPLGDLARRRQLASGLAERNLFQPALRQFQMILRLGPQFNSDAAPQNEMLDAAQRVSALLANTDPMAAADCWDSIGVACLSPMANIQEPDGYCRLFQQSFKFRAVGHLEAGRDADAIKAARDSLGSLPLSVQLAIDLVPEFERHDRPDLADELFAKQTAAIEAVLADFPKHAVAHNDLAWLAAKCRRRIADSLVHAQRAVELVPDYTTFLDTLAEVRYQLGDREQALVHARRCLELEPRNTHFQRQFTRFETNAP